MSSARPRSGASPHQNGADQPAVTFDERREPELRDYLRVLRRRKWLVGCLAAGVGAAGFIASAVRSPVYQSSAKVLLQPRSTDTLFDPASGQRNDPARAVQTEIEVLEARPVRDAVEKSLGYSVHAWAVPVGQTDVIEVKAESGIPARAAATANAYARAYIDFRRSQVVDDLLAAGQEIQLKILDLQRQIDASGGSANSSQRDVLVQQQGLFKQKLDQLQVDAALKTGSAQIVTPATTPTRPVRPRPVRDTMVALLIGLLLGVGVASIAEYLDDSIKTKEDLERATGNLPVLGLIPRVAAWKAKDTPQLVSLTKSGSPGAEAYRSLRTSVQFMSLDRPVRVLQITSPVASEGKTTTVANLAVALARAGQRVVVVCCDLRRPRIHEFFGQRNDVGFTSVLLGDVKLDAALIPVPDVPNLSLLASGPLPPAPSELLSSRRVADVFAELQTLADVILIDTPPVIPVTDAAVLSRRVDAVLLVATARATSRKEIARSIEVLAHVEAPVVGTVLNEVVEEARYGVGYGYYGYREAEDSDRRPSVPKPTRDAV